MTDLEFRVVVGSFKKPEDAKALAAKVNAADPTLRAYVGDKAPCNDYYPVIVSDNISLDEAKRIQAKALKLDFLTGAYLSPAQ